MNVNMEIKTSKRILEIIKWIIAIMLLLTAIAGNYLCRNLILPLRIIIIAILIMSSFSVILSTIKGKKIINFFYEARIEIRKVIWASRQETLRTTLIVIIVTTVMSIVLWGLDSILVNIVSFITSLRF